MFVAGIVSAQHKGYCTVSSSKYSSIQWNTMQSNCRENRGGGSGGGGGASGEIQCQLALSAGR